MVDTLLKDITNRNIRVGIVGLGYVGLPLACTFAQTGFNVLGFDIDHSKIDSILFGHSYISTVDSSCVGKLVKRTKLDATTDFSRLTEVGAIIICVPTPLTKTREPDLSFIENTTKEIAQHLRPGQIIVLESTTYPGTTDEIVLPILEHSGLKVGKDFFLGFSPEREDPGNPRYSTKNIPKVVSGHTPACNQLITALYGQAIDCVVPVSSTRAAEMTKLIENIYRSVNIALVNELKILCHRMGLDVHEILDAAATKPFGFQKFTPGPGLGGHCLPLDPKYLSWKAQEFDFSTRFINLADEINVNMPYYVVQRVTEALNRNQKSLNGSSVLLIGVAYKRDIDDMRESPALKIIELLRNKGAVVSYHDPLIPKIPKTRHYSIDLESVPLNLDNVRSADCVLIITDHSAIDYVLLHKHARLIVDTRNVMCNISDPEGKIFQA